MKARLFAEHSHSRGSDRRAAAALRAASTSLGLALLPTLSGCAGTDGMATAALPTLPSLPKIELPKGPPPVVGTPTEVYERIGRGAMACWFGAGGPLKGGYIYDASADPPHKGGQAEIYIRVRDEGATSPRGIKAFRIAIAPSGTEETTVIAENLKLPEPSGNRMKASVAAWSQGNQGCDPETFTGAWNAASPPTPASETVATVPETATAKTKAARQSAQATKTKPK